MSKEPVDDFQDDSTTWYDLVAQLIDEIESLTPELLDRRLPKRYHERLHNLLLDARDLKMRESDWIH